jgi:hypothetical protein
MYTRKRPGEGDVLGDAGALGVDGLLGDLHQELVALLDDVLDGGIAARPAAPSPALRVVVVVHRHGGGDVVLLALLLAGHVGDVQERRLVGADVHEGGLDARKHRLHPALVHVAHHPRGVGAVHHQLHQDVVLEDGDPRFLRGGVHQDLALHAAALPRRGAATGAAARMRRLRGVRGRTPGEREPAIGLPRGAAPRSAGGRRISG